MKRALLLVFAVFVVSVAACASTGGVAGDGLSAAAPAGTPGDRFQTGHALFSARCQRCHALPEPSHLRPEAWPVEVAGMSRKAGLSSEQATLISDYLVATSRSTQRTD